MERKIYYSISLLAFIGYIYVFLDLGGYLCRVGLTRSCYSGFISFDELLLIPVGILSVILGVTGMFMINSAAQKNENMQGLVISTLLSCSGLLLLVGEMI